MNNAPQELFDIIVNDNPVLTVKTLNGTPCYGVFGDHRGCQIHNRKVLFYKCTNMENLEKIEGDQSLNKDLKEIQNH